MTVQPEEATSGVAGQAVLKSTAARRVRRWHPGSKLWKSGFFINRHVDGFVIESLRALVRDAETVLDIGCGAQPFRTVIERNGAHYLGIDFSVSSEQRVDALADAARLPLRSNSVQVALCTELLEHVPSLSMVLAEVHRVLASGGRLIVTVPFMFGLHEEPHDYMRPTVHLLRQEAQRYDFQIEQLATLGNEAEVIATTWDVMWSWRLRQRARRHLFLLATVRTSVNVCALALSPLLRRGKAQAYLTTGVVMRKPHPTVGTGLTARPTDDMPIVGGSHR